MRIEYNHDEKASHKNKLWGDIFLMLSNKDNIEIITSDLVACNALAIGALLIATKKDEKVEITNMGADIPYAEIISGVCGYRKQTPIQVTCTIINP